MSQPESGERVPAIAGLRKSLGSVGLLRQAGKDGELAIDDPQLAGQQLHWLIPCTPLNTAMLCPDQAYPNDEPCGYSDAGVRTFLATYRPAGPPPVSARPGGR